MASYLLDTNILLRSADDQSAEHVQAREAVARLLMQGDACYLTSQILIEFWAVATRPVSANGLGWDIAQTRTEVGQLLDQFPLLEERPEVFPHWLSLVTAHSVSGKRVHDLRILAVMLVHRIDHVLTFNVNDFPTPLGITIVHPSEVA
jgi:predicted nucleic acid-binding protein